ncbi:MAG: hypothetical protein ACOYL7_03475 [Caldilinea sp.]
MLTTLWPIALTCYGAVRLLRRSTRPDSAADSPSSAPPEAAHPVDPVPDRAPAFLQALVADDDLRTTAILALGGATALTHLLLGAQLAAPLLVWNGIGYAALLASYHFVPRLAPYRATTRDLLSTYTGTTLVLYFVQRGIEGLVAPAGAVNKLVEVGLLALLWFEKERPAQTPVAAHPIAATD